MFGRYFELSARLILKEAKSAGNVTIAHMQIPKKNPAKPKPITFQWSIPFLSLNVWKKRNPAYITPKIPNVKRKK